MNQVVRRILIAVVVLIGGFLTLRLLDLLLVWSLYSWFFQTIRNASGMPDTLNGAFSIWLVAITLMLLPTFFSVLFWKRDPKKVALIVTAVSAWLVVVYFLSLPKEGRFFNPMTGKAMYRYSYTPDGKIDFFPPGYNFHPRYGTKLELVTPELVKEMDRKAEEEKAAREREEKRLKEVAAQEKERERQAAETALRLAQKEQELAQQRAQEKERQRQLTEAVEARERERRRQLTEAVAEQEMEWQKKEVEREAPDPVAAIAWGYVDRGLAAQRKKPEIQSSGLISRRVTVNRNRPPLEALLATGRKQDTARVVVEEMPQGEGRNVEVFFFTLGRHISHSELIEEYESRGLKPADPYSLAAVNEHEPSFAETHPNVTGWKNSRGWQCFAAFHCDFSKRDVSVGRSVKDGFGGRWWYAGLRK